MIRPLKYNMKCVHYIWNIRCKNHEKLDVIFWKLCAMTLSYVDMATVIDVQVI